MQYPLCNKLGDESYMGYTMEGGHLARTILCNSNPTDHTPLPSPHNAAMSFSFQVHIQFPFEHDD